MTFVTTVLVLLASLAFGGGDQYLGSLSAHPWMADVSLLSAPWCLLPFAAGLTQRTARRAAGLGLAATFVALAGYCLMTLSPVENAHFSLAAVAGFIRSDPPVFIGGVVTGPVFGWLAWRWRERRTIGAALVPALAMCLEPAARVLAGRPVRYFSVWAAEVVVGAVLAAWVAARARTHGQ